MRLVAISQSSPVWEAFLLVLGLFYYIVVGGFVEMAWQRSKRKGKSLSSLRKYLRWYPLLVSAGGLAVLIIGIVRMAV